MTTTIAQIINGTIDPSWVIAISILIIGFLLVWILNRIVKTQDRHGEQLQNHETRITVIEKVNEG
jgi:hypothetical protein